MASLVQYGALVSEVSARRYACLPKHLDEQGLQVVGQPIAHWVSVHHCEEDILCRNNGSLWHGHYGYWQLSAALVKNVLPTCTIEVWAAHVLIYNDFRLVNLLLCDNHALQIAFDEVLQAKKAYLAKLATTRFKVGIDVRGVGWILPIV
eukprot:scaffold89628_cov32-Tisochrysis_lutea.AAC.2